MNRIRVLIADDHALVRAGFRALLESQSVEVVAEANDGREAVELTKKYHPDIVLMDIGMSGLNGIEAASRISREFPSSRILILSMHANEEYVLQALRAGACGYLLKDSGRQELMLAVRSIIEGKTYLSPEVSKHVIDNYVESVGGKSDPLERLTPRQREILQLIAEGRTNKEIAQILKIAVKTVDTHRTQLMERLDIHDVAGLVRFAIQMGLVPLAK
ncbi:MAG TPA: response regulator transcription factor [Acidobacteriota bacterium]|jgi:DNA-binding NarL/FixJ family response regulator